MSARFGRKSNLTRIAEEAWRWPFDIARQKTIATKAGLHDARGRTNSRLDGLEDRIIAYRQVSLSLATCLSLTCFAEDVCDFLAGNAAVAAFQVADKS